MRRSGSLGWLEVGFRVALVALRGVSPRRSVAVCAPACARPSSRDRSRESGSARTGGGSSGVAPGPRRRPSSRHLAPRPRPLDRPRRSATRRPESRSSQSYLVASTNRPARPALSTSTSWTVALRRVGAHVARAHRLGRRREHERGVHPQRPHRLDVRGPVGARRAQPVVVGVGEPAGDGRPRERVARLPGARLGGVAGGQRRPRRRGLGRAQPASARALSPSAAPPTR